jgi:hypothetical protein
MSVTSPNRALLLSMLEVAVPMHQVALQRLTTWPELAARRDALALEVASTGDVVMYRGKVAGSSARAFNALAESIALASFVEGGVEVLGRRWTGRHPAVKYCRPVAVEGWDATASGE